MQVLFGWFLGWLSIDTFFKFRICAASGLHGCHGNAGKEFWASLDNI
jgi:hypothetical protein